MFNWNPFSIFRKSSKEPTREIGHGDHSLLALRDCKDNGESNTNLCKYWYAHGNYMNRCCDCREGFIGDKHAGRCRECAEKLANETTTKCGFGYKDGCCCECTQRVRTTKGVRENRVEGWACTMFMNDVKEPVIVLNQYNGHGCCECFIRKDEN